MVAHTEFRLRKQTKVTIIIQAPTTVHYVEPYLAGLPASYYGLHAMEGSSHDRGLYAHCFEELFDLSNSDSTSTSCFNFSVTVFELYNEQTGDFLPESGSNSVKIRVGSPESFVELVQEKVDNPLAFSKVLNSAFESHGNDVPKLNVSHLIAMMHIYYNNLITGENMYSKLPLVDLAGSDGLISEDESGERLTDLLHVMKSLSSYDMLTFSFNPSNLLVCRSAVVAINLYLWLLHIEHDRGIIKFDVFSPSLFLTCRGGKGSASFSWHGCLG